jgi:hypothetical protein
VWCAPAKHPPEKSLCSAAWKKHRRFTEVARRAGHGVTVLLNIVGKGIDVWHDTICQAQSKSGESGRHGS